MKRGYPSKAVIPPPRKRVALEIEKIPVPKGSDHIPPPHGFGLMPVHEATIGFIAPKGKGKTTTIINTLDIYRDYYHEIHIFSPSIKSDIKWKYAKQLNLLAENKALKQLMKTHENMSGDVVKDIPLHTKLAPYVDMEKAFDPKIPEVNFHDTYTEAAFKKIMDDNRAVVDILDEYGYLKTLANRILIVFDDPIGQGVYNNRKNDYFTGSNTRHRHHSASIWAVTQGYKEIPKTVRTNFTSMLIYEIGNMKELQVIYEEFTMGLTWRQWLDAYYHATEEDHSFLFLDMYGSRDKRIRKNFDKALQYKRERVYDVPNGKSEEFDENK